VLVKLTSKNIPLSLPCDSLVEFDNGNPSSSHVGGILIEAS